MRKFLAIALLSVGIPFFAAAADSLSALKYADEKSDILIHLNSEELFSILEKSGISKEDILLIGRKGGEGKADSFKKVTGLSFTDIKSVSLAFNAAEKEFYDSGLILIAVDGKKVSENLSKSPMKINGLPAVQTDEDKKLFAVKAGDIIAIGKTEVLEVFLQRYLAKKERTDKQMKKFISEAKGNILYQNFLLNEEVKAKLRDAFSKDMRMAVMAKNNPFVASIYNLDEVSIGFDLGLSGGHFSLWLTSSRSGDGKNLEMLSHTAIVGASFVLSAYLSREEAKSGDGQSKSEADFQEFLQKIETERSDKGVKISLAIGKEEGAKIIQKIKESIAEGKAEAAKEEEAAAFEAAVAAVREGDTQGVDQYLAKGKNINAKGYDSSTLLSVACEYERTEMVSYLLKKGADPNQTLYSDKTPLMIAASNGYFEVVKILVAGGADKTKTDEYGSTAADKAAEAGYPEIEQFLSK